MKRFVIWCAILASLIGFEARAQTEALKVLPVQDAGRLKPYESFARETLQLVYGSQTYRTPSGDKRPAIEIVLTWMLVPKYWDTQKIVQISHKGLKDSLNLPAAEKYFSPAELLANERLPLVMQDLAAFRATKQKLDPWKQAAQRLENQLGMYQAVRLGKALRVAPPLPQASAAPSPDGRPSEPDRWIAVSELESPLQEKFYVIIKSFIQALPASDGSMPAMPDTAAGAPSVSLAAAVEDFKTAARAQNPALYPPEHMINIEVHEKALHPFMWSWILYLLAAIILGVAWQTGGKIPYQAGWIIAIVAFLLHNYGFGLRMYLTGRPPVSNMYETVVWVSWGALVFAMIFEVMYKRSFVLLAGCAVGTLCLIVADMAPTVLDPSLQPLEPVLRSNLWLTVHVLTITLSYSAFFLAWGLGNIGLCFLIRGDSPTSSRVRDLVQSIYRCLQVGVVLLAAGTILGGVWADYSWGRFWGWDPKETWALIALLGYLALLHGRLVGWVQAFGMMAGSIAAFNLVIMAWYGVNYVLGAGLHTYGFGAGGVQYVSAFVILNLIFVAYAWYVTMSQKRAV